MINKEKGVIANESYAETDDYITKTWDPLESTCRHASLSIL